MAGVFKLLKWLVIIIAAIAGLLVSLPWLPVLKDQFGSAKYVEYLEQNAQAFSLKAADGDVRFDDDFYASKLIILSEMHGYAVPQLIDMAMVANVHANVDHLTYLAEMSPAQALAVNEYLAGGADTDVRRIFDLWAKGRAQWANNEFFAKLEKMRAFNESVPVTSRVWIVGVDQIHDDEFAKDMAGRVRISLAPSFGNMSGVQAINSLLLTATLGRDEGTSRYVDILENIELMSAADGVEGETFYGLWGLFHGSKTPINGSRPLAMRLDEKSGLFKDKVSTVLTTCVTACFNMMPGLALPGPLQGPADEEYTWVPMKSDDPYLWRIRGVADAKAVAGDGVVTLFRTDAPGTPYDEGPRLISATGYFQMMQRFQYDGGLADAADYFMLMQKSTGLTPWDGDVYDITGAGNKL